MSMGILVWAVTALFAFMAWSLGDTGATFIILMCGGIVWHLHVIEVKLNKLLDREGIRVTSADLRG